MAWETLPEWVWYIYYSFFILTFVMGLVQAIRKRRIGLSLLAVITTILLPIVFILFSIGRPEGMNELEHYVFQLKEGSLWSILVSLGFAYLFVYWVLIFIKEKEMTVA
ncbi:hypothetical protein FIU87_02745 [Bacillus sp. THAF10]|uniref:hypothetical protein n=1 Tax=Bacillus sp. THAF10 TaxID=2587848 RepID=UPI0012680BA7|nr:hypothetical protein [Bacillus sp. THAF10]QFT87559.1 hypothetical protein FIU87_02745 [Bacillus sp. THAF10]